MNTRVQIIIIIFFAVFFRLFYLDLIEFKYDETLQTFQTYLFFEQPFLPQTGMIASTGVHNFPLFNYLLIIIGLFSQNPEYLSFVIAFLNVCAVILFYFLTRKIYGSTVGFISALSLSISPWAIIFSRKIWAQDLILIFAVPFFYFLQKIIISKKSLDIIKFAFLLFLLIQLHASGIFLAIAVILIFIFLKIKINLKKFIIGFFISSIFVFPFIIFQIFASPFCPDCNAFLAYLRTPKIFNFENFIRPLQIINGSYFEFLMGKDYGNFINSNPLLSFIQHIFLAEFLFILGAVFYFLKFNKNYLYLPILVFIISFLYFITRTPSFMHYFVIILPIVCIIYGLIFYEIFKLNKNCSYKLLIIFIFLLFFMSKFFFSFQFFDYINNNNNISGDYGPAYKLTESRIDQNLQPYSTIPDYEEMKNYGYIFINTSVFHQKMGDYFVNKNYVEYAFLEYQKAIENNQKDSYSKEMINKITDFLSKQKLSQ